MNLWYNKICIRSSFLFEIADAETVSDMKGQKKTNAARILDGLSISYELREFPVDLDDLSAVHAAEMLRMPVEQVFKTLVARTDKAGVVMACIPGAAELDQGRREQEGGDGAPQGSACAHGLSARRLLAAWREERVSCVPRRFGESVGQDRRQCGQARRTDRARARRFGACRPCDDGTADALREAAQSMERDEWSEGIEIQQYEGKGGKRRIGRGNHPGVGGGRRAFRARGDSYG